MPFVAPRRGQDLTPIVEAAFGADPAGDPALWVFTDITKYVRGSVTLSGGSQSNASSSDPSTIVLNLENTDGRFTARNPLSPYWPNVVRNVPLRVSVTWAGASDTYELLTAFVNGWPLQPNAGVISVWTPITATGRLRRLQRSAKAAVSALRGSTVVYSPVRSYWPLENGTLESPLPGVPDAQLHEVPAWADATGFPGSDTLPVFTASTAFLGSVAGSFGTGFSIDWYMNMPAGPTNPVTILQVATPSTAFLQISAWQVTVSASTVAVNFIDGNGNVSTFVSGTPTGMFGSWQHLRLQVRQPVATCIVELDWIDVASGTSSNINQSTGVSTPFTVPARVAIPHSVDLAGSQFGHVTVSDGNGNTAIDNAATGWTGELTTDRVTRVCAENSIPVTLPTIGTFPAAVPLGPQPIDTTYNVLADASNTDNGLLHDAGTLGNLVYLSGSARYNALPWFTLDYIQHQIGDGLAATYDDQDLTTAWTVSRTGGGSVTYMDPSAVDDFSSSATVNPATDRQLIDIAGWRTHLGVYDAYRLPSISVDIRNRSPELAQALASLLLPRRMAVTNLPAPYPPDSLDQFVEGFTTTVDAVTWQMTFNCRPYGPWQVALVDAGATGRVAVGDSTLAANITATQTSFTATTPTLWTTSGADFPVDLNVGGERVTAGDCNNGTSVISQDGTFEVADTTAWVKSSCTFVTDTAHVHTGGKAAKLVVTGTPTNAFTRIESPVVAADTYTGSVWMFSVAGYGFAAAGIDWYNSSHVFISSSLSSFTAIPAAAWTKFTVTAAAPAGAAFGQFGPQIGGSPATGTTVWADDAAFTHQVGAAGSTQTFTVVRAVNGITKTHTAGESVDVWLPAYVAL